ncbi:MAG: hypothetical protein AB7F09_17045 [Parvibaculaceae bacterium]
MLEFVLAWMIGDVLGRVAHQRGHVAAAYLAGFRLQHAAIGQSFSFSTDALPEIHLRKTATLIRLSGGAVANVLLLAGGAVAWVFGHQVEWTYAFAGFAVAQVFHVLATLWPDWIPDNDGRKIVDTLKLADGGLTPCGQSYLRHLADYCENKDPIKAISPATQQLMLLHAVNECCDDLPTWEKNFGAIIAEVERDQLSAEETAMFLDTLVTATVVRGKTDTKPYLDEWSARAMKIAPHIRTIAFSRAAALIELEHFTEGKSIIEKLSNSGDRPYDMCLNKVFLARAEAGLGDRERANELLAEAEAHLAAGKVWAAWLSRHGFIERAREALNPEHPV